MNIIDIVENYSISEWSLHFNFSTDAFSSMEMKMKDGIFSFNFALHQTNAALCYHTHQNLIHFF